MGLKHGHTTAVYVRALLQEAIVDRTGIAIEHPSTRPGARIRHSQAWDCRSKDEARVGARRQIRTTRRMAKACFRARENSSQASSKSRSFRSVHRLTRLTGVGSINNAHAYARRVARHGWRCVAAAAATPTQNLLQSTSPHARHGEMRPPPRLAMVHYRSREAGLWKGAAGWIEALLDHGRDQYHA